MKVKLYTSRNKLFFIGFVIIVFICILVILANQTLKDKQLQMKNELLAEKKHIDRDTENQPSWSCSGQ